MLGYRNIAQFGLMIEDTSRGHIPVGRIARAASPGRPIIRYDLNAHDVKTIKNGVARLAELLFAAGANRVILPLARAPGARRRRRAARVCATTPPARRTSS